MQMIVALVQPFRLENVRSELLEAGISGMTVCECCGHGRQMQLIETRLGSNVPMLLDKVKVEVAVTDHDCVQAIEAIVKGARLGKIGDGKIFITALERVVAIRTGGEDDLALQSSIGLLVAAE